MVMIQLIDKWLPLIPQRAGMGCVPLHQDEQMEQRYQRN